MGYWTDPPVPRRVRAVDVARIASVAVELLDAGGFRALTLRAVASRLGVAPASLYSRIRSVDDLYDLALDAALRDDAHLQEAIASAPLRDLVLALHRHLLAHPWACQVVSMRAPRGPHYLRLSERMCVLTADAGSPDPLGDAYALSNLVIGSALTAAAAAAERSTPVDPAIAPRYAALREAHAVEPETVLARGLEALLAGLSSPVEADGLTPTSD